MIRVSDPKLFDEISGRIKSYKVEISQDLTPNTVKFELSNDKIYPFETENGTREIFAFMKVNPIIHEIFKLINKSNPKITIERFLCMNPQFLIMKSNIQRAFELSKTIDPIITKQKFISNLFETDEDDYPEYSKYFEIDEEGVKITDGMEKIKTKWLFLDMEGQRKELEIVLDYLQNENF
jgi:hypothetical protein